ncbi:hypothetical protein [Paludibacterium paludis]|nr:hypothetical protein [Paludibacterium paludis]
MNGNEKSTLLKKQAINPAQETPRRSFARRGPVTRWRRRENRGGSGVFHVSRARPCGAYVDKLGKSMSQKDKFPLIKKQAPEPGFPPQA